MSPVYLSSYSHTIFSTDCWSEAGILSEKIQREKLKKKKKEQLNDSELNG